MVSIQRIATHCGLVVLCLIGFAPPSFAFKALSDEQTSKALTPKVVVETGVRRPSEYSYYAAKVGLKMHKVELNNAVFSLSYETFDLAWSQLNHSSLSDQIRPIATIERWRGHLRLPYRVDDRRLWLAEAAIADTREQGASPTFTFEGYVLYSQARNVRQTDYDSWQLGVFMQQSQVEQILLPIVEITFNLNNPQSQGFYGHVGFPKTQLGYHFGPRWRSEFEFVYCQVTAGLRKDNRLWPKGYAQLKSWRSEWKTTYRFTSEIDMYFSLKYTLSRDWVRYDKFRNKTGHSQLDNTMGYGLGLQWQL